MTVMAFDLGSLRERLPFWRKAADRLPQAYYLIPLPPSAPASAGVSFFDKDTMLPRAVDFYVTNRVIRCTLPPSKRVEIRVVWIEDSQLEGVRYVLGPASKFRVHGSQMISEDLM